MVNERDGSSCLLDPGQADDDAFAIDFPSDDDDHYLTDWEREFLASLDCQDYDLTDAQQAKLEEIEALVEERRGLAFERYERELARRMRIRDAG